MEQMFGYTLGQYTNERAGTCKWCFGTKNGQEFFIKEFLNPKYPYQDKVLSPRKIEEKKAKCRQIAERKIRIYDAVNRFSDGNDVRIHEFFRYEQKFYLSMEKIPEEKIDGHPWTIGHVYGLPESERRRLCSIIAHAVAGLHRGGLAHSDLKHENILFTKSANGTLTAKVIDFDSAFLESDEIDDEDISGDWVYFSPEVWGRFDGIPAHLTCKIDIFALGVLFHQYFCGEVPDFDHTDCTAAGQAVRMGLPLTLSDRVPEDIRALLAQMLQLDPALRPTAFQVFEFFQSPELRGLVTEEEFNSEIAPAREGPVRYCTNCGRTYRGEGLLCSACAAAVKAAPVRNTADPYGVGFRQATDFFKPPSDRL